MSYLEINHDQITADTVGNAAAAVHDRDDDDRLKVIDKGVPSAKGQPGAYPP